MIICYIMSGMFHNYYSSHKAPKWGLLPLFYRCGTPKAGSDWVAEAQSQVKAEREVALGLVPERKLPQVHGECSYCTTS